MAGVLIYGPPKSGKTLLALYLASRAGRPLLINLDGAPPLVACRVPSLWAEPSRLAEALHRALKLASTLGCRSVVADSLAGPIERLGAAEVAATLRGVRTPSGVTLVATSPFYLSAGLLPVKSAIDRASGELVAAGPGTLLRIPLSQLIAHLWGALHGSPGRLQEAEA